MSRRPAPRPSSSKTDRDAGGCRRHAERAVHRRAGLLPVDPAGAGLLRSLAYNAIVLASVTTLLFNANPLLRYDGYYILADWVEIPNLATRANRHWQYLAERTCSASRRAEPPPATAGRAALVHRLRTAGLRLPDVRAVRHRDLRGAAVFLCRRAPGGVGVIASLVCAALQGHRGAAPPGRSSPARTARVRGVLAGGLAAAGAAAVRRAAAAPHRSRGRGLAARAGHPARRRQRLRAHSVTARPGASGAAGRGGAAEPWSPALVSQHRRPTCARRRGAGPLGRRLGRAAGPGRQLEEDLRREQAGARAAARRGHAAHAARPGRRHLLIEQPDDLPGRFVKKGEVVGYLWAPATAAGAGGRARSRRWIWCAWPPGRWRSACRRTWAACTPRSWCARCPRPDATCPARRWARAAAARSRLDPRDRAGTKTLESLFEFELQLPSDVPGGLPGQPGACALRAPGRAARRAPVAGRCAGCSCRSSMSSLALLGRTGAQRLPRTSRTRRTRRRLGARGWRAVAPAAALPQAPGGAGPGAHRSWPARSALLDDDHCAATAPRGRAALDDPTHAARAFALVARGQPAQPGHAAVRRAADGRGGAVAPASWPRCRPARARPSPPAWPPASPVWPACRCMWSPSTTTWPARRRTDGPLFASSA
jgi:hypothetical protein